MIDELRKITQKIVIQPEMITLTKYMVDDKGNFVTTDSEVLKSITDYKLTWEQTRKLANLIFEFLEKEDII